jgi:Raf kinase inhibitor-like YbhB/YbcL family protein
MSGKATPATAFRISSPAFQEGQPIPKQYTCEGEDTPPRLDWSHAPEDTRSFALIVDDPDAPSGTWTHWLLYDVPATTTHLDAQSARIGKTLENDFEKPGYGGPCPPKGHGPHHYRFTLYALDTDTVAVDGDTREALEDALRSHTIASTRLIGTYERRR